LRRRREERRRQLRKLMLLLAAMLASIVLVAVGTSTAQEASVQEALAPGTPVGLNADFESSSSDGNDKPRGHPDQGTVITNGTVSLGVNQHAQLIVPANVAQGLVGVLLNATGFDGLRSGCECEGWGAGYSPAAQGRAYNALGPPANLRLEKFQATKQDAESIVVVEEAQLEVTHFYRPSAKTPFLYEIDVTLRNVSDVDQPEVRYTRSIDWDVEPTPFAEVITLIGNPARTPGPLLYSDDNGFTDPFPFAARIPITPTTANQDFTDLGPYDHGALFDFAFKGPQLGPDEVLGPGQSKKITIFYGAAPTEAQALEAVNAVGAEVFTFGQTATGGSTGTPNTFIFGYEDDDGREGDSGPIDDTTTENG
jgi:hypothetical protein